MTDRSRFFPVLRYRDTKAAIHFLVEAFGFSVHARHEGSDGSIVHAELQFGESIVMLGSFDPEATASGRTISGGTSSVYASVPFVDAHHDRAMAAGAIITRALADTPYGSREYSCRDIDGYEWHFGTYDPFDARDDDT